MPFIRSRGSQTNQNHCFRATWIPGEQLNTTTAVEPVKDHFWLTSCRAMLAFCHSTSIGHAADCSKGKQPETQVGWANNWRVFWNCPKLPFLLLRILSSLKGYSFFRFSQQQLYFHEKAPFIPNMFKWYTGGALDCCGAGKKGAKATPTIPGSIQATFSKRVPLNDGQATTPSLSVENPQKCNFEKRTGPVPTSMSPTCLRGFTWPCVMLCPLQGPCFLLPSFEPTKGGHRAFLFDASNPSRVRRLLSAPASSLARRRPGLRILGNRKPMRNHGT